MATRSANRELVLSEITDAEPVLGAGEPETASSEIKPKRVVLEAADELVIRCGKSSITLTREGKVIVKGVKIVSRASQENAIKGAQIVLN